MCVYPDMWCIHGCRDCGVLAIASWGIGRAAVSSWNDQDLSWRGRLHDQDLARAGSAVSQVGDCVLAL